LSVYQAKAQEVYTLEKCKQMALENNAKSRNSRLAVEAAEQTRKEAFTKYFPSVSATGMGYKANRPILELGIDMSTLSPGAPPMAMSLLKDGVIGSVTATQPVFAGGQIVNGNKLAKLGVEVSRFQQKMADDEILLKTEEYYWQLCALEEKARTIAEVQSMLNNVYKDVKGAYEAGLTTKNELLKVELKQNELASGKLSLDNGLKLVKMVLGQHIGVQPEDFTVDESLLSITRSPVEIRVAHDDALTRRNEYQLLDKGVEAARLQKKMEIGKNLPTVAIGAAYNYLGFDRGDIEQDFGMVFATVSIPVSGWWGGSHAIKKQSMNIKIAENNKQNASEMLLIQMQQLWNELEEAYRQMELAQKSIAVATENVRLNTDYYKAGTSVLTDLLDAQSALQQARDRYTEAATVYQMKLSNYLQATGRYSL
jgi:outer membrane protein TolC